MMRNRSIFHAGVAALPLFWAAQVHAALPDPVKAMLEMAALQGTASDVDMVASLARLTNPEDIAEINALLTIHLAGLEAKASALVVEPEAEPEPEPEPLPDPGMSLLETAIKGGKDSEVEAIGKLAKVAYPDEAGTYDMMLIQYRSRRAQEKEKQAAEARRKLAEAGFFENWKGEGQIGATLASGNTTSQGVSAGLALTRKGVDWTAKFRTQTDYQRTDGKTSVERYVVEAEPQYQLSERAFAYGLGRWEKDQILGYDQRWNVSGGLGYKIIAQKHMTLSLKGGPAWRQTDFITGISEDEITGLAGIDFGWQMTPVFKLTQVASTVVGSSNSQTSSLTALNAKLSGGLSARIAYSAEIASNPPIGVKSMDSLTRSTLVYGF